MRMIFSTVFGPHEPALTVGSLAMTATGRPAIVPAPGLAGGGVAQPRPRPAGDRPGAGDDAVGAEAVLLPVGEQGLLDERALVEQPGDAFAHGQLALLGGLGPVTLGPAGQRPFDCGLDVAHAGESSWS